MTGFRAPVAGTEDDYLYQTIRCNVDSFILDVPDGSYAVTLKFCEGEFDQVGSGTTVFTLPNAYAGSTTISAGTLRLGANEVIPDGTNTGNVLVSGTLDLNGYSETIN